MSEANLPADERVRSPIRDRFGLVRLADKINASIEKHFWRWASLFTIIFLACSIARDLRTKLWFDELFTLYLAKLASPQEIINFNDASPPLYPIIVHWLLPIVGNDALAVRLPATLGYCAMIVCLLAFCRRRLPAAFAFAASLLTFERACISQPKAEPMALVLGCAAGALLCWQMAAEGRRRGWAIALLAVCLALMVALHYYAIFFLVPLFLAEVVRWREFGKSWTSPYGPPWCRRRSFSDCTTFCSWRARTTRRTSGRRRLWGKLCPSTSASCCPRSSSAGSPFCVAALLPGSSARSARDHAKGKFAVA